MKKTRSIKWPSQSLVNKIALIVFLLFAIYGISLNYYRFIVHSEDIVPLKAKVTDKVYSHIIYREYWNLKIEYRYDGELYHYVISCTKDNYQAISPGDSIDIKIYKKKPKIPFHIHDGIIGHNEIF